MLNEDKTQIVWREGMWLVIYPGTYFNDALRHAIQMAVTLAVPVCFEFNGYLVKTDEHTVYEKAMRYHRLKRRSHANKQLSRR